VQEDDEQQTLLADLANTICAAIGEKTEQYENIVKT
jgi:hypothetical protein